MNSGEKVDLPSSKSKKGGEAPRIPSWKYNLLQEITDTVLSLSS